MKQGGVCDSDLRSAGSEHSLCSWIHMHSTAVFLCWATPCPHSHHETAAVRHMLCDLKHIHTDIRFTEIPKFTVLCKFTRIITHIPLFAASWRGELSRWAGWWTELYIRMRLTRAGFPLQHALKRGVTPSKETAFAWMHTYCSH